MSVRKPIVGESSLCIELLSYFMIKEGEKVCPDYLRYQYLRNILVPNERNNHKYLR